MSNQNLKKYRCCFTGHRPEKLKIPEEILSTLLETEIQREIEKGFTTFISGMARGVDIIAAEIILKLKKQNSRLKLICALPYPDFGLSWNDKWLRRYKNILDEADLIRCICPDFSYSAFQQRNKWMIDHSSFVIAVFNGKQGGTKNTLAYARKNNVPYVVIDDSI